MSLGPEELGVFAVMLASIWVHMTMIEEMAYDYDAVHDGWAVMTSMLIV